MLACLAASGLDVIGVDLDPHRVAAIAGGRSPVHEPGVAEILADHGGRIRATMDAAAAVALSQVTFLVVATPSEPDGGFSLRQVEAACSEIGRGLREKEGFHLVVLTSTVMPGATGGPVRERLEEASGLRCGVDFGLCYSPEFIALGSVVHDLRHPDFVLIGESDPRSGERLAEIYRRLCANDPPVARMSFVNAELAKLALNTYVTTKISFANMLAGLCERLPGASVDTVTAAVGLDRRIGSRYLQGGAGYGGPCFPRDNAALASLAHRLGAQAFLAEATDRANRNEIDRLVALVAARRAQGETVGVLGLAYKPGTDVSEASPGLLLARALAAEDVPVIVWDPAAMPSARTALDGAVLYAASLAECIAAADLLVLATPWPEIAGLGIADLARPGKPRGVIDCWRLLDRPEVRAAVSYVGLGLGPAEDLTPAAAPVPPPDGPAESGFPCAGAERS
jgi:UDPglucose 6-dehydrogenase